MVLAGLAFGSVSLVLLAAVTIYVLGERLLEKDRDVPLVPIEVVSDPAVVEKGERLATITGCNGCHGPDLSGRVFFDAGFLLARIVAPNLSTVAAEYTDAELARTIRYGVRPDGRAMVGMPSAMFYHLTDQDLGAIIAYVRSMPQVEKALPESRVGPLGRFGLLTGKYPLDAQEIEHLAPPGAPVDRDDPMALGRYMALTSCTECHGSDLGGADGFTPGLAIAAAYDEGQFRHFMRTGEALGGRELELMSDVARYRFNHMTEGEIQALHRFLRSLGDTEGPAAPHATSSEQRRGEK